MNTSKKNILTTVMLAGAMMFGMMAKAQVLTPEDDGIIPDPPKHFHHNRVVPYPFLREADMLWSYRHWERIYMKEKINMPMYYPIQDVPDRKSLYSVLRDGILEEGTITEVFGDDRFEIPLTEQEVQQRIMRVDTTWDPDDPTVIILIDTIKINPNNVIAFDIKSDWYFDKQRGELKNRIIGISPRAQDPKTKDVYNLFWVWFPDARYALSTHVAYNMYNNNNRLTFDQLLHLRMFNSVIYKEDNVYDRTIAEYKRNSPMDQLLEAQHIKDKLRNMEHDMWEY
ncbi:MAG: gliding motility protein GldN [Bacteroidota bacterium]|nr:gliding motility protein GldN [Bacteroidota bacterium]MDX5428963.1 gliding motility protein GldN [Bacteroidota bacterium]MDX5448133.1 gliding motility protein GldN [Bacteroidota bacterium]MDX5506644.1 gliding motility protein GldN [Bacteroidota bacterium]